MSDVSETALKLLSSRVKDLESNPIKQPVIDKMNEIITKELKERDRFLKLELENLGLKINSDFGTKLSESMKILKESILSTISDQKKVKTETNRWTIELVRFGIYAGTALVALNSIRGGK
tara:strand:- start:1230 stop:1589 length:360 start_codon:yes stop_codon:yes gene_type:complete